ncbi:MAG: acyltransferase domain-containing protein [Spirochaetales bacterium]|nr:acyltransferase domain-containing protein [Spirochaetales bacterium]
MQTNDRYSELDIAVIGMACKLPGADSVGQFWENLKNSVNGISAFNENDLLQAGYDPDIVKNPHVVKAFGEIEGGEYFDAPFFDITAGEAKIMDPQHRLFLETSWKALEDAGYDPAGYNGLIGIFGGISTHYYLWHLYFNHFRDSLEDLHLIRLNLGHALTTRVAYKLNLKGPSITVQTACSTSLVAVHLAVQSLLGYESDMALAGGVTIEPYQKGYFIQEGVCAPDGKCKAFDARADGMVGGSGAGLVVLKRLTDAMRDGDHIYAVIKGSAVNNDGSEKIGYSAPGIEGQSRVILSALDVAGVDVNHIRYVETHGTGTSHGDPIEVQALSRAFRKRTDKKGFCALGALKANIGHVDNASGVAGVIKAALVVKHGIIPPNLHFQTPNPNINFDESPFYVPTEPVLWDEENAPRVASVSSFGFGGTNAHVILQEPPPPRETEKKRKYNLFLLSAKSEKTLDAQRKNFLDYFRNNPDISFADAAYTLQVGRRPFNYRMSFVGDTQESLVNGLEGKGSRQVFMHNVSRENRNAVFMFPGAGAGYNEMGGNLYGEEPAFKNFIDECSAVFEKHLGFNLVDACFTGNIEPAFLKKLRTPAYGFPFLFIFEYALAQMLMEWGIKPVAAIGHSFGEYAAACLAGVFSLEDAAKIIIARGKLFEKVKEGSMVSVLLPEKELSSIIERPLYIAAVNAPNRCFVSGPVEAVERLCALLNEKKTGYVKLPVKRAGHSDMVDDIIDEFKSVLESVTFKKPSMRYISNLTGDWARDEEIMTPSYWAEQMRQPVLFQQGFEKLSANPDNLFIEVGPAQNLSGIAMKNLGPGDRSLVVPLLPEPRKGRTENFELLFALGKIWAMGVEVDWKKYHYEKRRRVSLPTYPFDRQRYWLGLPHFVRKESDVRESEWSNKSNNDFYTVSWTRACGQLKYNNAKTQSHCLIFADNRGYAPEFLKTMGQPSGKITLVKKGRETACKNSGNEFIIDPGKEAGFAELYRYCRDRNVLPCNVVSFWEMDDEKYDKSNFHGFLSKFDSTDCEGVWNITENFFLVTGNENPGAGTRAFKGKTHLNLFHIDIDGIKCIQGGAVLREILSEKPCTAVAYRNGFRWEKQLQPICSPAGEIRSKRFLIKGGSLSVPLLRSLADIKDCRVVLWDENLPDIDTWEDWEGDEPAGKSLVRDYIVFDLEKNGREIRDCLKNIDGKKGINDYSGLEDTLEQLAVSYILEFLLHYLPVKKGLCLTSQQLEKDLHIIGEYRPFISVFLKALEKNGIVGVNNGEIVFLKDAGETEKSEVIRARAAEMYPGFQSLIDFFEMCVKQYHAIFSGQISAQHVLYPEGNPQMVHSLYDDLKRVNVRGREYIRLAGRVIQMAAVQSRKPLKILEVGAGTGTATDEILPFIKGLDIEYRYTDIGMAFVQEARKKYDDFRFSHGLLDISKDPVSQGFEPESFDVIISFNVIHATENVEQAMDNVKKLLAPNGLFLLMESFLERPWVSMMAGLFKGWMNFIDDPLRKDGPLMPAKDWEGVLHKAGFQNIIGLPDHRSEENADFGLFITQNTMGIAERKGKWIEQTRDKIKTLLSLQKNGLEINLHNGPFSEELKITDLPVIDKGFDHILFNMERDEDFRLLEVIGQSIKTGGKGTLFSLRELSIEPSFEELLVDSMNGRHGKVNWKFIGFGRDFLGLGDTEQVKLLKGALAVDSVSQVLINNKGRESGGTGTGAEKRQTGDVLSETEKKLVAICDKVLGISQMKVDDDFFNFGADSLLALQLLARIRSKFNVNVPVKVLYEYPTIRELSAYIEKNTGNGKEETVDTIACLKRGNGNLSDLMAELVE